MIDRGTVLAGIVLGLALGSCGREATWEPHRGPVILITLDALRADAVGSLGGEPGLTPHLDALASSADLAVRAIAPSSWTVPSMASLFTGLQPYRHGNWHGERTVLADSLQTLPEVLGELGFRTTGFRSNHWLQAKYGYAQGFDRFGYLRHGKRAEAHLAQMDGGPELVWIHILPPHAPYVRRDHLLERLGAVPGDLPERVRPLDLEPYYDPGVSLPAEVRARFWALYRVNVAWADEILGRMLAALEKSGHAGEALIVVTSDHGEEFGDDGQIAHGGNLGRALVEVPLVVRLPKSLPRPLAVVEGETVANVRLWATVVEAAGGEPSAAAAPSLFAPAPRGALSELYLGNGTNLYSFVDGDEQLVWETPFAPPEADYFRAKTALLGGEPEPPLRESPRNVFDRLAARFDRVAPLSGGGEPPRFRLYRWPRAGAEPLRDPGRRRELARRLRAAWLAANGAEQIPASRAVGSPPPPLSEDEMRELRALGYAAGNGD